MQRIFSMIVLMIMLGGCSLIHVHKMNIEQGNIICQDMINRLHPGMTVAQVQNVMGSPILMNTFTNDRIDYVYTNRPGYGQPMEKLVTLIFKGGILQEVRANLCMPCVR